MTRAAHAILVIADALDQPFKQIPLLGRRKLTIGRDPLRDVVINDREVEPLHCILYTLNGEWCPLNTGPAGLTTVDEHPINWKRMAPGRVASLGPVRLWVTDVAERIGTEVVEIGDYDLLSGDREADQIIEPVRPQTLSISGRRSAFLDEDDVLPLVPDSEDRRDGS